MSLLVANRDPAALNGPTLFASVPAGPPDTRCAPRKPNCGKRRRRLPFVLPLFIISPHRLK
jgi:hypothetical protein